MTTLRKMPELALRIPRRPIVLDLRGSKQVAAQPVKLKSALAPNRMIEIISRLRTDPNLEEVRIELRKACDIPDLSAREANDILLFLKQQGTLRRLPDVVKHAVRTVSSCNCVELICRAIGFIGNDFYNLLPSLIERIPHQRVESLDQELLTHLIYGSSRARSEDDVVRVPLIKAMLQRYEAVAIAMTPRQISQSTLGLISIADPVDLLKISRAFTAWAAQAPPPTDKDLVAFSEICPRLSSRSAANLLLRRSRPEKLQDGTAFIKFSTSVRLLADPGSLTDGIGKFLVIFRDRISDGEAAKLKELLMSLKSVPNKVHNRPARSSLSELV